MKTLFPILCLLFITACNNNVDEPIVDDDSSEIVQPALTWQAALNDTTGKLEMSQILLEGVDYTSAETILNPINQTYPEIKVDYLRSSSDTVFLKIDDGHYLTQQMGSAGATIYLAALVFNITELPAINYVNIQFEPGDHAQPGTFTRKSFIN